MGIGAVNLGETPCCGIISRSWEAYPSEESSTGWIHTEGGGEYVPEFREIIDLLDSGTCPDCGRDLRPHLRAQCIYGFLQKGQKPK